MASCLLLWEVNADDAEKACFFGCKQVSRQLGISSHIQHKGISFLLGPGKHVSQLLGEVQALDVFYFVDCLSCVVDSVGNSRHLSEGSVEAPSRIVSAGCTKKSMAGYLEPPMCGTRDDPFFHSFPPGFRAGRITTSTRLHPTTKTICADDPQPIRFLKSRNELGLRLQACVLPVIDTDS